MNNEIKKILESLKHVSNSVTLARDLDKYECRCLLDYITNLEEECHKYYVDSVHYENLYLEEIRVKEKALEYMRTTQLGSYVEMYKILGGNPMDLFKEVKNDNSL